MKGIEYYSPKEAKERDEEPQHHFDLVINGTKIGGAEIDYFSKPLPLYQLSSLYVDFEEKGKGYASNIMDQVEQWLRTKKKPGVLADAIDHDDPAWGMYKRRGWVEVPNEPGLFVYNWPQEVDISTLDGYDGRYTDYLYRKGFTHEDLFEKNAI